MSDVKRYDAVHIRYEDSNIRYGEGCEVEVVAAYDYDALKAVNGELLDELEDILRDNMVIHSQRIKALAAIAKARGDA